MALTITTNNVPRDLLDWHELTAAERAEFDYVTDPDADGSCRFFRYRGATYDLHDMPAVRPDSATPPNAHDRGLQGWDAFASDSFFSGIAVRFPLEDGRPDYERIIVGLVIA